MKTNPIPIVIAAGVILGAGLFPSTSLAQPSVSNLYDALSRSDTRYTAFTYDPADAVIQDTDTEHHIQGIAYANGYYYVAQSRPTTANTEKLLVVSEDTQTVVNKLDLDPGSIHPGGLQAHNGYMVIPFEVSGGNAKLNFYSLSTPTNPVLVASYQTALGNGYCAGMTDYGDKYLVAQYYSRTGSIRFYHFDSSFNKVAEKTWRASTQTDKSGWYPYTDWRTGDYNYEAMNLIKVLPPGSSTPSYFMIMYHNTNSADVFALSDPNLSDALQVTMVYSLQFTPYGPSFRYGAGLSITDPDNLLFFSSLKHVHASKSANVISDFESRPAWPWKLPYNYATGGDADVAINESGVCVELRRGAPGTADATKIFSQVGVTMPATRTVAWGSSVDTGQTGETVSVAVNSSGYCVALSRGTGSNSNQHTYRVGEVDVATKTITWGSAVNFQTGGNLAVALDDSNHVVEVHRGTIGGANENKHYYRVGTLDPSTKTITWLTGGTNFGTGGDLSLAIDDSGHAIEIHRGTPGTSSASSHYYRTASINTSTGVITWGAAVSYDTGGDLDIALDNSGRCLEVHRGTPGGSNEANLYYKVGVADFATGAVTWGSGGRFDTGSSVCAALDSSGNGIALHRGNGSSQRSYRLFVTTSATSNAAAATAKPPRATITLSGLTHTYDGTSKVPVAVTTPANLAAALTYDGSITAPTNAGSYPVVATIANPNYIGSATGVLVIQPAAATVTLSDLSHTYDGSPKSALATTNPVGLPVSLTYEGGTTAPTNAGSYSVGASVTDPNYAAAPASGTLVIEQAAATITLPSGSPFGAAFTATYSGAPQDVAITTSPAGIPLIVTYNGSTTAPTLPGTYQVVVTSADPNYAGSAQGTLVITSTALVRHAPTINGDLDGSLQLLSGESFTLNSSGSVASDVLVPGTPTVQQNGHPTFAGVVDADGAIDPSNYSLTLNSGAVVRYVVRRVDPIALPVVTVNVTGTRDVALNNANQNAGDLATVRSLTLNGNSSVTLGTAGATEPAVYELQSLTLNGNASVQIAGPVKLKLASGLTLNGTLGSAEHPEWLQLEIANGGLTVNGNGVVNAIVTAPNGSVMINGTVNGRVTADRLTINGSGVLADPAQ